jgi:hypothetical protein
MLLDIGRAGALCKSRRNVAVLYNTVVSYESIILLLKYCCIPMSLAVKFGGAGLAG